MELDRILPLLKCTVCGHARLERREGSVACAGCDRVFAVKDGVLRIYECEQMPDREAAFQQEQMLNSSMTGKLFNLGKKFVSSEYVSRDQIRALVNAAAPQTVFIELGSGNRSLGPDVINTDIFPFPNVHVTMDAQATAFRDGIADYVVVDCMLEHVPNPAGVVNEVYRILKPGGTVVSVSPWIFPYHGYPSNYFNISSDGLNVLFSRFSRRAIEFHHGPSSALTHVTSEYFAVALSGGNKLLYTIFKGLFLAPIFWLKFLDRLWPHSGSGLRIASTLCMTAVK